MAIFSLGGLRRCAGCSAAVCHRLDSGSERISGAHPLHQLFRCCSNRTDCGDGCGIAALRPEHTLLENGRLRRFYHVFHLFSGGGDAVSGRQVGSGQFVCAAECRRLFWRCASGKAAAPLALCSVKTGGTQMEEQLRITLGGGACAPEQRTKAFEYTGTALGTAAVSHSLHRRRSEAAGAWGEWIAV